MPLVPVKSKKVLECAHTLRTVCGMGKTPTRIKGTNLYLDRELVEKTKIIAAKRELSLSAYIEKLMKRAVAKSAPANTAA